MRPFTYEMYNTYYDEAFITKMKLLEFEYIYAIGQLTDESTEGDFDDITYLKRRIEHWKRMIVDYTNCISA